MDRLKFLRNESDLKWAFNQLDKNSDGYISLKEFKNSFGFENKSDRVSTKVQREVWKEIDAEFKEIDTDGDGKIDFNDFKENMYQLRRKGRYDKRLNFVPSSIIEQGPEEDSDDSGESQDLI